MAAIQQNFFLTFFVMMFALLTGCGGGGSSGVGSGDSSSPAFTSTFYKKVPLVLPNISDQVSNLCEPNFSPFVSLVTPIDLNNDGRLDLVVHVWCNTTPGGGLNTPTPDRLIALLQAANGTFSIANQQIFGQANVSIGGASRKVSVGDLNHDGFPDLAYAVNMEDGRAVNAGNQSARPAVVLSQGNGQYQVMQIGNADWLHAVAFADNALGGLDAIFQGFSNIGSQAFRYVGNAFTSIAGYPAHLSAFTFQFFPEVTANTGAEKIFSSGSNDANDLDLYVKSGGNWSIINTFHLPQGPQNVPFITWQQTSTTVNLMRFAGFDLIATAFNDSCLVKMSPITPPIVIANLNGYLFPSTYQSGAIHETDLQNFNGLLGFDTNGNQLTYLNSLFTNLETNYQGNFFDCKDINGDGYQDIAVYPNRSGGVPILYLNNTLGHFTRYDTTGFPTAPSSYGIASSVVADINGDGVNDLIYFPKNITVNGSNTLKVYFGDRYLQ